MSGGCLEGVWRMSGGCLEGAWEVSESKMIFLGEEKKICPKKLKIKLFTKAKLSLFNQKLICVVDNSPT